MPLSLIVFFLSFSLPISVISDSTPPNPFQVADIFWGPWSAAQFHNEIRDGKVRFNVSNAHDSPPDPYAITIDQEKPSGNVTSAYNLIAFQTATAFNWTDVLVSTHYTSLTPTAFLACNVTLAASPAPTMSITMNGSTPYVTGDTAQVTCAPSPVNTSSILSDLKNWQPPVFSGPAPTSSPPVSMPSNTSSPSSTNTLSVAVGDWAEVHGNGDPDHLFGKGNDGDKSAAWDEFSYTRTATSQTVYFNYTGYVSEFHKAWSTVTSRRITAASSALKFCTVNLDKITAASVTATIHAQHPASGSDQKAIHDAIKCEG